MLDSKDFQRLVRAAPGMFVMLRPDAGYTILAATEDYLRTSHCDDSIVGRPLFEVFPDNPSVENAVGSRTLRASLALAVAKDFQPDVVVLDIAMPVLDGMAAARALRALPEGRRLRLLALSGFGQDSDRQRSVEAGFDAHFVKPVDLAELEKVINSNPHPR
jgi:CheY-like chemotaxis protein